MVAICILILFIFAQYAIFGFVFICRVCYIWQIWQMCGLGFMVDPETSVEDMMNYVYASIKLCGQCTSIFQIAFLVLFLSYLCSFWYKYRHWVNSIDIGLAKHYYFCHYDITWSDCCFYTTIISFGVNLRLTFSNSAKVIGLSWGLTAFICYSLVLFVIIFYYCLRVLGVKCVLSYYSFKQIVFLMLDAVFLSGSFQQTYTKHLILTFI